MIPCKPTFFGIYVKSHSNLTRWEGGIQESRHLPLPPEGKGDGKSENHRLTRKSSFFYILLVLLGVIQSGCQNINEPQKVSQPISTTMKKENHSYLSIYVIDTLGYIPPSEVLNSKSAWENLLLQKPDAIVYTITANEIEGYSWKEQIMVLNTSASIQFKQAVTERFQAQMGVTKSMSLESLLDFRSFTVFIESELIYSGLFIEPYSALAVKSPICYVREEDGHIAFVLRPFHSIDGDYSKAPSNWFGIKDERIHIALASAGKIK